MGTSNFSRANASKVYAIYPDYEMVDEDEQPMEDEWWYEDQLGNVKGELKHLKEFTEAGKNDRTKRDNRSYPSSLLGNMKSCKWYKHNDTNIPAEVSIDVIVTSGYYEGASFDWEDPEYSVNDTFDDPEDIQGLRDDLEYYYDVPEEESLELANTISAYLVSEKDRLVDMIEKVFEDMTTPLNVVGTFSNGETIYAKA